MHTSVFLLKNNETQCIPLLCLPLRFMAYTHASSFILGKLSLEKTPLNLGLSLKYLEMSILHKG